MKDLGKADVMFGIKIKRDRANRKLFISQPEYTEAVLERFGMKNSKPMTTPMEKNLDVSTGAGWHLTQQTSP